MSRHLTGIVLAIVMVLAMFFAGAWGYVRLLRLPAATDSPLSALPAQGGSLLSNSSVLAALGAMAAAAVLAGILIATPRISPLASGLPGLFALGWQALYLLSVHRAVQLIPLRAHAFGAGWEAMLINGTMGAAGAAMIIPLFVPSRWRGRGARRDDALMEAADVTAATDYMADLKATVTSRSPADAVPTGAVPVGRARVAGGPAPTAANPVPGTVMPPTRPTRTGLVGGPRRPATPMRPRPYRRPAGDQ